MYFETSKTLQNIIYFETEGVYLIVWRVAVNKRLMAMASDRFYNFMFINVSIVPVGTVFVELF